MKKEEKRTACEGCGELVSLPHLDREHEYICSHCNHTLYRPGAPFTLIILMAFSALILLLSTAIFPIISLDILGSKREMYLVETALYFLGGNYNGIGLLVLITGVVFPLFSLFLLLYILLLFRIKNSFKYIRNGYILYVNLKEWGFMDVYLLAIFISMIKLEKMGDLEVHIGLITLFFAMLLYMLSMQLFNPKDIWFSKELEHER